MSALTLRVTVSNPATGAEATVNAVVDTKTSATTLPASLVRELALAQEGMGRFRTPGGDLMALPTGVARLTVNGRSATVPVLLSPDPDTPLSLGMGALASMDYLVDPAGPRLIAEEPLLLWEGAYGDVAYHRRSTR